MNYFLPGPSQEANMRTCATITEQLQKESKDIFTGIDYFDRLLSLRVKANSKPYQAPPSHVSYD